ncbi:hypothetical protein [Pararhodobacter sp. CCB-MM2]|nr:hypothetical protein [Pararhodobacter sp. CCB-MM2]MCA2013166.1 hypothetical protein [Cereibacter sphaeroides]
MKTRRQKRAVHRNRNRLSVYLYGSDREGVAGSTTCFAGCSGGVLSS